TVHATGQVAVHGAVPVAVHGAARRPPGPSRTPSPVRRDGRLESAHDQVGIRDCAAARPCHEADPGHLGRGRLGTRPGRARAEPGAAGGLPEAREAGMSTVATKLAELGLSLPEVVPPLAAYQPAVQSGPYVYTAGQLPMVDGKLPVTGKVGAEVTAEEAKEPARTCA